MNRDKIGLIGAGCSIAGGLAVGFYEGYRSSQNIPISSADLALMAAPIVIGATSGLLVGGNLPERKYEGIIEVARVRESELEIAIKKTGAGILAGSFVGFVSTGAGLGLGYCAGTVANMLG